MNTKIQDILIAFLIIKPHIHGCCGPMKGPHTHWTSSSAWSFSWQSKYTQVFSNNVDLPTTTHLFVYVFIWISCVLVEMSATAGSAIWASFDKSWLGPTRLHHFALRLGYFSWGLIMMLLSQSLRPLCSLVTSRPSEDTGSGRFPLVHWPGMLHRRNSCSAPVQLSVYLICWFQNVCFNWFFGINVFFLT